MFKPPPAIGSVPILSGHAIACRWRSLPRVRQRRAGSPQDSSSKRAAVASIELRWLSSYITIPRLHLKQRSNPDAQSIIYPTYQFSTCVIFVLQIVTSEKSSYFEYDGEIFSDNTPRKV